MTHSSDGKDSDGTERIPDDGSRSPPTPRGVLLLLYYRDGIEHRTLPPGVPVVVGRHPPADFCVPDRTLSREHARFTLQDRQVLVEDLGSTNGTSVDGQRIDAPATLPLGGEAMLGTVLALVIAGSPAARATESDEAFRARLDQEITRARTFQHPFALLAVRSTEAARPVWARALQDHLRPVDHVTLHGAGTALILLPETRADEALRIAERIAAAGHRVSVAMFPEAASTADALIEMAWDAVGRASSGNAVILASPPAWADLTDEGPILGAALRKVYAKAERAARTSFTVLIHGETGTGKELLAAFLHEKGPRRGQAFLPVNCGAIAPSLLESHLFGHAKGAFTGADKAHPGVFKQAHGGTLFLDEIGELSLPAQAALLRVLEDGTYTPVGGTQKETVDVRVIAATHRDLEAMTREGDFREDLFYRLNTVVLHLPPLRERRDEIEPLCRRFLALANKKECLRVRGFTSEALAVLHAYHWPGNVRELRNAVECAMTEAEDGELIQPDHLLPRLRRMLPDTETTTRGTGKTRAKTGTLKAAVAELEAKQIEDALRKTGSQRKAAKLLDLSITSLGLKMKALGIASPQARGSKKKKK